MAEGQVGDFKVGQVVKRTDLHAKFGGQEQGGIVTPAKHPVVLAITGKSGRKHGYNDYWHTDGTFRYYGEGQVGDMVFQAGNKAIRDHAKMGKQLLLWRRIESKKTHLRLVNECICVGHVSDICQVDSFCCDVSWDSLCVSEVRSVCDSLVCEESQGACNHTLCVPGVFLASGCDVPPAATSCVASICAVDGFCCNVEWDSICVGEVSSVCGANCNGIEPICDDGLDNDADGLTDCLDPDCFADTACP